MKRLFCCIMDVFWPTRCAFCDGIISPHSLCCDECREKLAPPPPVSLPMLDSCLACTEYTMEAAKAIYKLKFKNQPQYSRLFADLICERLGEELTACRPDCICCVSMHRKKQRQRGYNQAELLAREIAKRLDVPFYPLLKKTAATKAQHTLTAVERENNLSGVYTAAMPEKIKDKRVLIVDDVITTGATLSECALTLRREGAAWVGGVAFAHPIKD